MKKAFLVIGILLTIQSCSDDELTNALKGEWLLPKKEVHDGGPGKDGIPAISNPNMVTLASVDFLDDSDLVVLLSKGGEVNVYPHRILDSHEIVNDDYVTISYCPLTGSAIGLNNNIEVDGQIKKTTFGVSGLLYNTNLILYDRLTDSYWSQMKNQCVAGNLIGIFPKNEVLVETTVKTVKEMFPNAQVLSNKTGVFSTSQYNRYPYGDYQTNNSRLLFPVSNTDNRVPGKERVLGVVINDEAQAFRFSDFSNGTNVILTQVGGVSIVVVGNSEKNYCVAYKNSLSNNTGLLNFAPSTEGGQVAFKDNLENKYNILGEVVSGPNTGERLEGVHSYMSFWFAWATFYPNTGV
jgi:hypothetical protein